MITDDTPVGTIGRCQICHRACVVVRHQGSDTTDDGETVTWDYRAWQHFVPPQGHDPEPMPSVLDTAPCPACARTMHRGHCCCGYVVP